MGKEKDTRHAMDFALAHTEEELETFQLHWHGVKSKSLIIPGKG